MFCSLSLNCCGHKKKTFFAKVLNFLAKDKLLLLEHDFRGQQHRHHRHRRRRHRARERDQHFCDSADQFRECAPGHLSPKQTTFIRDSNLDPWRSNVYHFCSILTLNENAARCYLCNCSAHGRHSNPYPSRCYR